MTYSIYTRKGDGGYTTLLSHEALPKDAPIFLGLGSLDEASSILGVVAALFKKELDTRDWTWEIELTEWLQDKLYTISTLTAWASVHPKPDKIPKLHPEDVVFLETHINLMTERLPALKNFCLMGGSELVSFIHYARTVVRRTECHFSTLARTQELDPTILPFLNRLSDHLFIFARWVGFERQEPETLWMNRPIPQLNFNQFN